MVILIVIVNDMILIISIMESSGTIDILLHIKTN
jgi:hypothetical protein